MKDFGNCRGKTLNEIGKNDARPKKKMEIVVTRRQTLISQILNHLQSIKNFDYEEKDKIATNCEVKVLLKEYIRFIFVLFK